MSYIGAEPTTAAFPFDQFSGNGTTTAFTLTYAPASTTSIIVAISGVVQNPNLYSVIGTTITFSPAPPTGTNNISVLYLGLPVIGVSNPGNTAYFSSTSFTATGGQTTFTPSGSYQVGFINVIRNGSQLAPADYTATNGTTVTLLNPCVAGDIVVIEVYTLTSISNALPLTGGTVTGASTFNSTLTVNGAAVSGFTGFKNRIINPEMDIDQRNNGASVTPTSGQYTIDRWITYVGAASKLSVQRSSVAPAGFTNSALITSLSAYTVGASETFLFGQKIEGFNFADMGWGTASAATITLSFWVRSSLTGTFGGSLGNGGDNRWYPFSYTISAANTWEQKTLTIAGDTTGTWLTNNGIGLNVYFNLGTGATLSGTAGVWTGTTFYSSTGATSVVGTNGATFYITGVQLERGSNATSFEFRDYGRELIMCMRYYERRTVGSTANERLTTTGLSNGTTQAQFPVQHLVQKRASPAVNVGNLSNTSAYDGGGAGTPTSWSLDNTGIFVTNIQVSGLSGTALGRAIHWTWNNASPTPFIEISSEL
jgi:hypothetical protein